MPHATLIIESPVGPLLLAADEAGITECRFDAAPAPATGTGSAKEHVDALAAELAAYFAGERRDFTTPLSPRGTEFQLRVWRELLRIPFGETISYGELARRIGDPGAARAVGAANGANPISIVVPCHRVIDSAGRLHGYGGGLDRKAKLLNHERTVAGVHTAPLFAM